MIEAREIVRCIFGCMRPIPWYRSTRDREMCLWFAWDLYPVAAAASRAHAMRGVRWSCSHAVGSSRTSTTPWTKWFAGSHNLRFRVQGLEFRVQGSGFRGQGSGFRFQGSGFREQGFYFHFSLLPEPWNALNASSGTFLASSSFFASASFWTSSSFLARAPPNTSLPALRRGSVLPPPPSPSFFFSPPSSGLGPWDGRIGIGGWWLGVGVWCVGCRGLGVRG